MKGKTYVWNSKKDSVHDSRSRRHNGRRWQATRDVDAGRGSETTKPVRRDRMGEKEREMKKIMFVAALAATFAAAAEGLESQNTVGYLDKSIGAFNLTLTTFATIGGDAVLGDIKPNAAFITGGTVQPFTSAGKAGDMYIWVNDPDMLEAFEAQEGWYLLTDDELTDCKNSVSLPFATGFVAKSPDSGAALIYSGEVKGTDTEIPIGAFTLTGNCSPVDLTLGDIVPNNAFIVDGTIQAFTAAGKAGDMYIWVNDPDMLEAFEADEGWYLLTDDELTDCKNNVSIAAGESLVVKSSTSGATITVPSPLK